MDRLDIKVVTTFHKEGYELYGKRFLESFAKNVDKNIQLYCFTEKCDPINPDPKQIIIERQEDALPKLMAFKNKWRGVPKANGIPPGDIACLPRPAPLLLVEHAVYFVMQRFAGFAHALLAGRQSAEVLDSFGHHILVVCEEGLI